MLALRMLMGMEQLMSQAESVRRRYDLLLGLH